VSKPSCASSMS